MYAFAVLLCIHLALDLFSISRIRLAEATFIFHPEKAAAWVRIVQRALVLAINFRLRFFAATSKHHFANAFAATRYRNLPAARATSARLRTVDSISNMAKVL